VGEGKRSLPRNSCEGEESWHPRLKRGPHGATRGRKEKKKGEISVRGEGGERSPILTRLLRRKKKQRLSCQKETLLKKEKVGKGPSSPSEISILYWEKNSLWTEGKVTSPFQSRVDSERRKRQGTPLSGRKPSSTESRINALSRHIIQKGREKPEGRAVKGKIAPDRQHQDPAALSKRTSQKKKLGS